MPSISSGAKPLFQTYILPAIPFRRRHSSNTSTLSTLSTDSTPATSPTTEATPSQPQAAPSFLNTESRSTISCSKCHAELALTSQIISKGFTGRHGRAYLVSPSDPTASPPGAPRTHNSLNTQPPNRMHPATAMLEDALAAQSGASSAPTNLPNTYTCKPVPRNLVTGLHTVCDVSCAICSSVIGWKYVGAEEENQRYKLGKFILESRRTIVQHCWEERGNDEDDEGGGVAGMRGEDEVMFDSGDEDECEDLFSGVWNPAAVRRRRLRRVGLRV